MVTEVLVFKGLVTLGHLAATHLTAGAAASLIHAAAGMTLAQLATATVTAGFVTGCVTWTTGRIKNVKNGVKALNDGNYGDAIKQFGLFAISSDLDVHMLPDTIEAGLEKMGLGTEGTKKVTSWVKGHEVEIARYVKNHK